MMRPHRGDPRSRRIAPVLAAILTTQALLIGLPSTGAADESHSVHALSAHAEGARPRPEGATMESAEAEAAAAEASGAGSERGDAEGEGIDDNPHLAVISFGATGERELADRFTHVGPAVGIEVEPIEHWLKVELGASAYRRRGIKGFAVEMPFKKPFELAEGFEVLPGIGPTWTHTSEDGKVSRVWGATAVVDFLYWPTRQAGWYLAPSYGYTPSTRQKSVALSFGIFFAVP